MEPLRLVIFDFDGTLYHSPTPPPGEGDDWWHQAYSLGKPGVPGLDHRWDLTTLSYARRAAYDPTAYMAVLTARPDYPAMRRAILSTIHKLQLPIRHVQLKPVTRGWSSPEFKAEAVRLWLQKMPTVNHVEFHDDQVSNHAAVKPVVEGFSKVYKGYVPAPRD